MCHLTLREEHKQKVYKNRVLRKILGLKSEKIIACWRKLHHEELHDIYC
jgi:hypothetical protein